jgi:S1-C subfamily serine protease
VPQNTGNRGGVVINSDGDVVAIMTDVKPYPDATEIHFALPIDTAVEVVNAILDVGEMRRPWFGFRLLEMNPQIERAYSIISDMDGDGLVTDSDRDIFEAQTGIDLRHALFIIYVADDSPALDAGLREADILMEFNGVPVGTMDELNNQIDRYRIGDRVTLEWMRREYAVWDPYLGEITIEYYGQREEEE